MWEFYRNQVRTWAPTSLVRSDDAGNSGGIPICADLDKRRILPPAKQSMQIMWRARSRPGCQGPQRKYAGYLSTTSWKLKVSGSRNSRVIGEMMMEKK